MLMTTSGGFPIQPVSAAAAAEDLLVDRSVIYERKEERKENKEKKREYQIVQLTTLAAAAAAAANTHGEAKEKVFISFFFINKQAVYSYFIQEVVGTFSLFAFTGETTTVAFFVLLVLCFPIQGAKQEHSRSCGL
jgi:hypothetical protein